MIVALASTRLNPAVWPTGSVGKYLRMCSGRRGTLGRWWPLALAHGNWVHAEASWVRRVVDDAPSRTRPGQAGVSHKEAVVCGGGFAVSTHATQSFSSSKSARSRGERWRPVVTCEPRRLALRRDAPVSGDPPGLKRSSPCHCCLCSVSNRFLPMHCRCVSGPRSADSICLLPGCTDDSSNRHDNAFPH